MSAIPEVNPASPSREALIHQLYEAAELEHNLMCTYLYAAFSLRSGVEEGVSAAEADATARWRRIILTGRHRGDGSSHCGLEHDEQVARLESARLCRCGGSGNKPFCDGTHATIGFKSWCLCTSGSGQQGRG